MARDILGHLFVSYSHADKPHMLAFRKHLQGMLLGKVKVWSDQDIPKGAEWESLLSGNLHQAASALVLASPDYLVSRWCRHELKLLSAARRNGRLRNVYWVQLKACGWQQTELEEFQSFEGSLERAITELTDEGPRQRAILEVCERIASDVTQASSKENRQLAWVRGLLLDGKDNQDIFVSKVLDGEAAFSIVCQGRSGSQNVAVKVLTRTPLTKMASDFLRIGRKRMELSGPSFVRIQRIFKAGTEEEPRIVIVSDYVSDVPKLSKKLEGNPFPVDRTAQLLRRAAEGLGELHALGSRNPSRQWEQTLGLLTPADVYFDEPAKRLRMAPVGVSSFLWHVLDYTTYAEWVDPSSEVYVTPDQRNRVGERLTPKTDQYMLARLGVEMLEGKPFKNILDERSATPEDFSRNSEEFLKHYSWARNHPQLLGVLTRMLQEDPANRYPGMDDVVLSLGVLEEEERAVAKRVYLGDGEPRTPKLEGNVAFFRSFYDKFFKDSKESKKRFKPFKEAEQHEKLMRSMVAVLNFRQGNEPTSLADIVDKHRNLKITRHEFEKFQKSFVRTLKAFAKRDKAGVEAWEKLLKPVTDYMILKCVGSGDASPGSDGGPMYRADAQAGKNDGTARHPRKKRGRGNAMPARKRNGAPALRQARRRRKRSA
jgi:hemoglobin-like flavoprotein